MAQQVINIGSGNNTGDGEGLRPSFDKINDNFTELYAGLAPETLVQLIDTLGWGFYVHDQSTPSSQIITTTASKLIIDSASSLSNSDHLPLEIRGISELWDSVDNKIMPINEGDGYTVRIDLYIASKTGSPAELVLDLDIGGTVAPSITIVERIVGTGKTPPYAVSIGFPYFALSTFVANGGQIFLSTDSGTVTLVDRQISIHRISNGDM